MTRQAALRRTLNLIILGLTAWLLLTALYVSVGRLLVPVVAESSWSSGSNAAPAGRSPSMG